MKKMNDIVDYRQEHRSDIAALRRMDRTLPWDLLDDLDRWPQHAKVIEDEGKAVAFSLFFEATEKTGLIIYVEPEHRNQGLGSLLLDRVLERMRLLGIKSVYSSFIVDERIDRFATRYGFGRDFRSLHMLYRGGPKPSSSERIRPYQEADFDESFAIVSNAFHAMRLAVGMTSQLAQPSLEQRQAYQKNRENIFVLVESERIVALAEVNGSEISHIAVKIEEQGRGFGSMMLDHAINLLLDRGEEEISLWVVDGNPAKRLYLKAGFVEDQLYEFWSRDL